MSNVSIAKSTTEHSDQTKWQGFINNQMANQMVSAAGLSDAIPMQAHVPLALLMRNGRRITQPHEWSDDYFTASSTYLRTLFKSDRKLIKKIQTDVLDQLTKDGKTHSYKDGIAKGYRLKPHINEALEALEMRYTKPKSTSQLSYINGKKVGRVNATPVRGKRGMKLPSIEAWNPINMDSIEQAITTIQDVLNNKQTDVMQAEVEALHVRFDNDLTRVREHLSRVLTELYEASELATGKRYGLLPQQFKQSDAGRWYGLHFNLQNCTRLTRRIALNGLHQYDISSCHHAIALQIAQRAKLDCNALAEYVENKSEVRKALAKELGVSVSAVKQALIAMIFGASTRNDGALAKALTSQGLQQAFTNKLFSGLHDELNNVFAHMLNTAKRHKASGDVVNALGLREPWLDNADQHRRLVAHLFQGIEAQALMSALGVHTSARLPLHDGWVTGEQEDTQAAIGAMKKATGFSFTLEHEVYQIQGLKVGGQP